MFLGVDGGGTKTAFCILSSDGDVVASAFGPGTDTNISGGTDLVRVLRDGTAAVCTQAGVTPARIDYAFFGLPSYGEVQSAIPFLDEAPLEVLHHRRYTCDNDMVCGWAGSLGTADGINIISGTGSMAYGEHAARRARAGGWGELFGDEGSAHWIATRGLAAFSRMSDGRVARGPLYDVLREHLGVNSDFDVIDVIVNRWGGQRRDVASLSAVVVDAAAQGDSCAMTVLSDAADELVLTVDACRSQLNFAQGEAVPVSYSGGVFSANMVLQKFIDKLTDKSAEYEVRTPLYPPVLGAALNAARLAGTPLTAPALKRLQSTIRSAGGGH